MLTSPIASILNRAYSTKFNILLFGTNSNFERQLAQTGHNLYAWTDGWPVKFEGEKPDNYHILPENQQEIPLDLCFDFVLIQDRGPQWNLGTEIANILHLPRIVYTSRLPVSQEEYQKTGDIDVYSNEEVMEKYGFGYLIGEDPVREWNDIFEQTRDIVYMR